MSWRVFHIAAGRYRNFSSLDLPGAKLLRTDEITSATYHFLVMNLRNCRPSFLTIPAVNSLYSWLEQEPPTGFNIGMNFAVLSPEQQSAMVDVGRTCQPIAAVLNRSLIGFWTRGHFQPSGPLIDFVTKECRPVGRVRNFELMVLRDSPPPKFTYCVTFDKEWRTDAPAKNGFAARGPRDARQDLEQRGLKLGIANLHGQPRTLLVNAGFLTKIGPGMLFTRVEDAAFAFEQSSCGAAPERVTAR
jgi:hypothetical protein